ncbi:MAG: terminase family protein [Nitrososphaera sp.]|nr:terminase family protein [Nitrososphaera sp.]
MSEALKLLSQKLQRARTNPGLRLYKPHPKQEQFHNSRAKERLLLGGNRSGKTVCGGVETVRFLKGELEYQPPVRGRIVTVDFDDGCDRIILPELARWIPPSLLKDGSWERTYNKRTHSFEFENKSTCEIMTYEQDVKKFVGTSRHFVWFDEEPPEDIYNECRQRLIDTNGFAYITMTPIEGLTWVYDKLVLLGEQRPSCIVIYVDVTENPYVDPTVALSTVSNYDESEQLSRKAGIFVPRRGFIYAKYLHEDGDYPNVIERWSPGPEDTIVAGMDHGFTNPTCFLWAALNGDNDLIVFDEYYHSHRTITENCREITKLNLQYKRLIYTVGDPSILQTDPNTGDTIMTHYAQGGVYILPGDNNQRAGLDKVRERLQPIKGTRPTLYISKEGCPNLLWEMKKLQFGEWQNRKARRDHNAKEEQIKKDDHACDALRYLVMSSPSRSIDLPPDKPDIPEDYSVALNGHEPRLASVAPNHSDAGYDFHLGEEW